MLYLADNAGETVFDRLLIERMLGSVIYAVKSQPFLNDACMADAVAAGLDGCATLIDNGAQAAGTILEICSKAFQKQFTYAPLIIAKSQANFERLNDIDEKVICLFQVKCPTIGDRPRTSGRIYHRPPEHST